MSRQTGPIEKAVKAACRGRSDEPLAQVAYSLARELDNGVEHKAVAGVARELRITLETLGMSMMTKEKSVADELRAKRAARQAGAAS